MWRVYKSAATGKSDVCGTRDVAWRWRCAPPLVFGRGPSTIKSDRPNGFITVKINSPVVIIYIAEAVDLLPAKLPRDGGERRKNRSQKIEPVVDKSLADNARAVAAAAPESYYNFPSSVPRESALRRRTGRTSGLGRGRCILYTE